MKSHYNIHRDTLHRASGSESISRDSLDFSISVWWLSDHQSREKVSLERKQKVLE